MRRILLENARALTDDLAARLVGRSASRYREIDPGVLSTRCRLLTEALVRSSQDGLDHLGEFVAMMAGGRLSEGFRLEDLQAALRMLEARAWRIVATESTTDTREGNLTALNTMVGCARDQLARAARAHAFAAASAAVPPRLEEKELFRGTESPVVDPGL